MKKASYFEHWPEYYFIGLLVLGLLLAMVITKLWLTYTIIFLCGFVTGRVIYTNRYKTNFPMYLVIFGFIVGYSIGAYIKIHANLAIIVLLFVSANIICYRAHKQGLIR